MPALSAGGSGPLGAPSIPQNLLLSFVSLPRCRLFCNSTQVAVLARSGRWQALNMHMGRARKLASEHIFSGVTTGAAGGGGGADTAVTGVGALAVSVAVGVRGASTFAGFDAPPRGRSAGFGRLSIATDAADSGALASRMVSMGSLAVADGVLSSMTSSGCTTAIGAMALPAADHVRRPQAAARTVNNANEVINTHRTEGRSCLLPPRLPEPVDVFLCRALEGLSAAAVCPMGSRSRRLRSAGFSSRVGGVLSGPQRAVADGDSSESSSGSINCVGA